jgi:repressor LexA
VGDLTVDPATREVRVGGELGERVVVRLSTGERYLKRLARGHSRGSYNLESWNARTVEDVRIEWIGEIIASVNPSAVRRIERRHQRARQHRAARSTSSI